VLIIAVSWKYGLNWGAAFAFASAGNQAALGAIDGHPFSSPLYFMIDIGNWLLAYLVAVVMCVRIRALNDRLTVRGDELDRLVRERTAELAAANNNLASFSYTAAHDLRTPLRAINSFSAIVLEKNDGRLDQFSVGYLRRIKNAGEHMSAVIEGLRDLIRESRLDIVRVDLDLSAMAQDCLERLAAAQPQRQRATVVQPGMRVCADAALLRVVIENLIGNAWKFSARTAAAEIEIGNCLRGGETWQFVRDNGDGFDMRYVRKLFAPFQRLHHADEFPGSGIGLARVHRIIERHRGEIRIESLPNVATTVFFRRPAAG
jgi:light-regulated signal transduction histidine kinase (bacteriophytochrome)